MTQIRVLAAGASRGAINQARGKLFEQAAAKLFRQLGYSISSHPSIVQAGLELDITGKTIVGNRPLIAECKCYSDPINAPKVQTFIGKFAPQYYSNPQTQGVFVALPRLAATAKGFLEQEISKTPFNIDVIDEERFVDLLIDAGEISGPPVAMENYPGTTGETSLLITPHGFFWLVLLIPAGMASPAAFSLVDAKGHPVADPKLFADVVACDPEIAQYRPWHPQVGVNDDSPSEDEDERAQVFEVRASEERFEYHFPSSPKFFVGRQEQVGSILRIAEKLRSHTPRPSALVVEGNSGSGKSSTILAACAALQEKGDLAISIDARSALGSTFVIDVTHHLLDRFFERHAGQSKLDSAMERLLNRKKVGIAGFSDAHKAMKDIADYLQTTNNVLVVFFDQFESTFFQKPALARIRQLFSLVLDERHAIMLGFAWKADLVASTEDFPFADKQIIEDNSEKIYLGRFQETETSQMLDDLAAELKARLPKDLRFTLAQFSQGYPWLLKKLCAHVIRQRESGVALKDMAAGMLNIEELFALDLQGLSSAEEESLRRIAAISPVYASQLGEEFDEKIVTSLMHRRLLVRVGPRYDVYWDIFRDYLTSGKLPPVIHFLPRIQSGPTIKAALAISRMGKAVPVDKLRGVVARGGSKSLYNMVRELRLSGLVSVENDKVNARFEPGKSDDETVANVIDLLHGQLAKNRLVDVLLKTLEERPEIPTDEVAQILQTECPYIEAGQQSWNTYARILGDWMDCAGLARFPRGAQALQKVPEGAVVRDPSRLIDRRSRGIITLTASSGSVNKVAECIARALGENKRIDWAGIPKSTVSKSLLALEDLKLLERDGEHFIFGQDSQVEFYIDAQQRPKIAKERLQSIASFQAFLDIIQKHNEKKPVSTIGAELRARLSANWSDGTSRDVAKYFLNWARFSGCDIGVY